MYSLASNAEDRASNGVGNKWRISREWKALGSKCRKTIDWEGERKNWKWTFGQRIKEKKTKEGGIENKETQEMSRKKIKKNKKESETRTGWKSRKNVKGRVEEERGRGKKKDHW